MWAKVGYRKAFAFRQFCTRAMVKEHSAKTIANRKLEIPEPEYNIDFICNPSNRDTIHNNIKQRKGIGDIDKVLEFSKKPELRESFLNELSKIPNCTDPTVLQYGTEEHILKECGTKLEYDFQPKEFSELVEKLKLIRTSSLGPISGQRSYMLLGDLAELEEALVQYSLRKLMKHGFKLVSVPDIIPTKIIERCGLTSDGQRTLVYTLDSSYGNDFSLSGTAEMSLAYKLMNGIIPKEDLPLKFAAVSRCFRAETSSVQEEKGIYRVHQFTKVEMFVCTEEEKSEEQFEILQAIQEDLFASLGIYFRIVVMPPHDLGAPAYKKVDMEGWMPGRNLYGELSSCSNCTDFQSRRLNIKYKTEHGDLRHVHTLNGTACAIPRMLITLCETYQTKHSRIQVPDVLVPYMNGKTLIKKQPIADMRIYKYKQQI